MLRLLATVLLLIPGLLKAQKTDYPLIGAQVFIEPGQTDEEIDEFFAIMKRSGMQVGRIRMFGAHMMRPDGTWDFSLYDRAFAAAERNGVRLFATLFPPTDELTDVGGFKFPRSKAHLEEIAAYIKGIVTHFAPHPALYTWVLQNEPGTGGVRVPPTDLSREKFAEWEATRKLLSYDNGYLKADFTDEKFLVHYTDWYLRWIASQVDLYDKTHGKHVNPHQILETLPEYDFTAYRSFLTSLGASMHMSWHFGWFTRAQYPLGVSVMADIIREGACGNPFWITELQGGNVTASGQIPYCPTGGEVSQYLWTGIAAGSQGVIFWTLNQRASVMEAGEWGMLDYQRNPSDRLLAAAEVAAEVKANAEFFEGAEVLLPPITLLYNVESMRIQRRNASVIKDDINEGRKMSAPLKSLVAAYEAFTSLGVTPAIVPMERFDWDSPRGQIAVIPDMICLPSYYWEKIRTFVKGGGKLIVTGLSGYYDENMYCLPMGRFPLADCFGGDVAEFRVAAPYFDLRLDDPALVLSAHLWQGMLVPDTGHPIATTGGRTAVSRSEVSALRNAFGKGEVIWVPALIDLGAWQRQENASIGDKTSVDGKQNALTLATFYRSFCTDALDATPVRFSSPVPGVLMRTMGNGHRVLTVIINKNKTPVTVPLEGNLSAPRIIAGKPAIKGAKVTIPTDGYAVCIWNRQ